MADEHRTWRRQDEGFWRAHHETWKRSDLNLRQYCEAEGIPLKAFGWRAQFKASERKLLYRRRPLKSSPNPLLSPVTYPSSRLAVPLFRDRVRDIGCVSAWNKDPDFGVIGIQSGPRH